MAQSDIQVLVGVLGGGSIRGESARLMKNQIGEIMNGISKSGNAALRIEKIIVAKQAKDSLRTALSSANLSAEIQNLSDAQMVGDMMTKVANEYAIDAGELGAALERGGASLAAANNTLAESMALMAAGNAAIQNAETVGKQHCPAA